MPARECVGATRCPFGDGVLRRGVPGPRPRGRHRGHQPQPARGRHARRPAHHPAAPAAHRRRGARAGRPGLLGGPGRADAGADRPGRPAGPVRCSRPETAERLVEAGDALAVGLAEAPAGPAHHRPAGRRCARRAPCSTRRPGPRSTRSARSRPTTPTRSASSRPRRSLDELSTTAQRMLEEADARRGLGREAGRAAPPGARGRAAVGRRHPRHPPVRRPHRRRHLGDPGARRPLRHGRPRLGLARRRPPRRPGRRRAGAPPPPPATGAARARAPGRPSGRRPSPRRAEPRRHRTDSLAGLALARRRLTVRLPHGRASCTSPRTCPAPPPPGCPRRPARSCVTLVDALGGRTLGLFSSRRAAQQAAEVLRARTDLPILLQGEEALPLLVNAGSGRSRSSCLFGVMSLWQGVDVPGDACQLVVIDRLPFPRPDEPLAAARAAAVDAGRRLRLRRGQRADRGGPAGPGRRPADPGHRRPGRGRGARLPAGDGPRLRRRSCAARCRRSGTPPSPRWSAARCERLAKAGPAEPPGPAGEQPERLWQSRATGRTRGRDRHRPGQGAWAGDHARRPVGCPAAAGGQAADAGVEHRDGGHRDQRADDAGEHHARRRSPMITASGWMATARPMISGWSTWPSSCCTAITDAQDDQRDHRAAGRPAPPAPRPLRRGWRRRSG